MKTKYSLLSIIGFLLVLFVIFQISCKKDDEPDPPAPTPPVYTNGEGEIGPVGGVIKFESSSPLYGVELRIPEGALDYTYNIKIVSAPETIKISEDTTLNFIQFLPEGLEFKKPVIIGLPISEYSDTNRINIINYNPESSIIEQLFKIKVENDILYAEIQHFSFYTDWDGNIITAFEMLKMDGGIGVRLNVGGVKGNFNEGLQGIPTLWDYNLNSGHATVWEAMLDAGAGKIKFVCRVDLYENAFPFDNKIGSILLAPERNIRESRDYFGADLHTGWQTDPIFLTGKLQSYKWGTLEQWFVGMPLIFWFPVQEQGNPKKYYAKATWEYNLDYGFLTRISKVYRFSNKGDKQEISEMVPYNDSMDPKFVDDEYQSESTKKPFVKTLEFSNITFTSASLHGEVVSIGSSDVIEYGHCWSTSPCPNILSTDPRTNFGNASSPISFKSELTNLQPSMKYYYRSYASNSVGVSYGSEQAFFTGNNPPGIPEGVSPADGEANVPVNTKLIWTCTDPEGDELHFYGYIGNEFWDEPFYTTDTFYSPTVLDSNAIYWWYIAVLEGGSNGMSPVFEFTTVKSDINNPPNTPVNIFPLSGGYLHTIDVELQWNCTDPDNDPLLYDVYFGESINVSLLEENVTEKKYDLGTLELYKIYFWKIVAKDNNENVTESPTWSFITVADNNDPPGEPFDPIPLNGSIDQELDLQLSWSCNDPEEDPLLYDIYFGNTNPPPLSQTNQSGTSFNPGTLNENSTYFWKIVAKDDHENETPGPVWSFITEDGGINLPPEVPSNPFPPDGAAGQSLNLNLQWTCTDPDNDPLLYDIYFGTTNPPALVGLNQPGTSYYSGVLNETTTYYWKIVAKDDHQHETPGQVWSFATGEGGGTGEPCPGIPTITYEGQVYNTVLIGAQCWLKENLNVGTMINGDDDMQDNGTIEKYCYDNDPSNCVIYGGLYQWNEMMQYVTTQGAQGICPSGWHIPTDDEWKILEGTVDSQYGVGDPEWDNTGWRGFDAGFHLKSTTGWNSNGNGDDLFGFTALPGGSRDDNGGFHWLGDYTYFCSSTEYSGSTAWNRMLSYYNDRVNRYYIYKPYGVSARCLQDY